MWTNKEINDYFGNTSITLTANDINPILVLMYLRINTVFHRQKVCMYAYRPEMAEKPKALSTPHPQDEYHFSQAKSVLVCT